MLLVVGVLQVLDGVLCLPSSVQKTSDPAEEMPQLYWHLSGHAWLN